MITNREPDRQSRGVDAIHCRAPRKALDNWADDGGSAAPGRKSLGERAANTRRADVRSTNSEGQSTMTIELTANQVRALRDLLETQISDLGAEIHHTRTPDYHETLKSLRESFKALDRELSAAGS
jgi:hypothetical protein